MDILVEPGYEPLAKVLVDALEQAQHLKGFACHANNLPFLEQEIIKEGRTLGLMGHVFQVRKKVREAANCPDPDRAVEDILGAMVYSAAMILLIREEVEKVSVDKLVEANYPPIPNPRFQTGGLIDKNTISTERPRT